jgi:flagellar export protein FliJ
VTTSHRFPLAQVLRVREIVADREEQALERIVAEIVRVRGSIERVDRAMETALASRERDLNTSMPGGHLHAACGHADLLRRHRSEMIQQLGRLEAERTVQTRAWEAAHRNREVLTGMRDEQQAAWRLAQSRAEQRSADESFLSRFHAN